MDAPLRHRRRPCRGGSSIRGFFPGGLLNWADFAVDRWVREGRGEARAVWWEGDDGATLTLTYAELKARVDAAAGAMRARGVGAGDVVALLLPMVPEAITTVLAAAKIGAVVMPLFSGYGAQAVRARLEDSGATLLVTCDAFPRRGRPVPLKEVADEAVRDLPGLTAVLVVRRLGADVPMTPGRDSWWHEECAAAEPVEQAEPMPADAPCLLLYTSGSTGRPKGCVHTHAGLPFKVALEVRHGMGVDRDSALLWLTDMGWVMGSFVIAGALTNGGTAVFFEGVPDWPEPDRLWAVAERSATTVLGISPTVVRALMAHGERWPDRHDLPSLRAIGSTGEPWNLEPWHWCAEHVGKGRVPIVNISGGTEIGGSLLCGSIHLPVKPTSFTGPTLGVRADVVDEDGRSVRGEIGELVVRSVWPGMTKGFWRDDGALPRRLLAALPRRLAPRRPGLRRRGRVLVPARPLRRHDQGGGQAAGPGRGGVAAGRRRPGARGGRDRRPGPGQGRGAGLLRRPARGPGPGCGRAGAAGRRDRGDGQGDGAQRDPRGGGAAQDPQRQDPAAGGAGLLSRRPSRRPDLDRGRVGPGAVAPCGPVPGSGESGPVQGKQRSRRP